MTARRSSPTVGRRRLGMELRRYRELANVTIDSVAEKMECSSSKISRIETGHIGASPRDVRELLAIYGVPADKADELVQVARDARERGWWQAFGQALTGAYVGLEAAAARIRGYEAQLVPGLLQIPEYASAVMTAARPDITIELLDRRLEVRRIRQSLLTQEDPLDFWVVIDEAAFRRKVGSSSIMAKQLESLVRQAENPNITIQVLPFAVGAHAGMDGTFAILEYEDPLDPDVVFA
ncbi:MAG TPA: helix-turn-helix transcriptional regulator, partial [Micromonosporaceae bacterium]